MYDWKLLIWGFYEVFRGRLIDFLVEVGSCEPHILTSSHRKNLEFSLLSEELLGISLENLLEGDLSKGRGNAQFNFIMSNVKL